MPSYRLIIRDIYGKATFNVISNDLAGLDLIRRRRRKDQQRAHETPDSSSIVLQ